MQKTLFTILLLFSVIINGYSQKNSTECKEMADSILNLIKENTKINPEITIDYCNRGIELAKKCHDTISLVQFKTWIGREHTQTGKYAEALKELFEAENLAKQVNDIKGEAFAVLNQGNVFFFHNLFNEAMEYYNRALLLAEECSDSGIIGAALHNSGLIYFNAFKKYDSALVYLNQSLTIFKTLNDTTKVYTALYNIGACYYDQGKDNIALQYLTNVVNTDKNYLIKSYFADALVIIGDIYTHQNNFKKAEQNIKKGIEIEKQINSLYNLQKGYKTFSSFYLKKNNLRKAYKYSNLASGLSDSLYKEDMANKLALLKIRHDLELKEQEIKILKAERLLAKEKEQKQKFQLHIIWLILLLFVIIIILFLRQYRIQKRFGFELAHQVKEKTHELKIALERAKKSDKMKTRFLQNVSHEVRTPINAIQGFSSILHDNPQPEDILKEYTTIISKNSGYLIEIFDNITDITRLENNDYYFKFEKINIYFLINQLFDRYLARCEEKYKGNVKISLSLNNIYKNTTIYSDFDSLYKVLYKVLDNALKFTKKGAIEFDARISDDKIKFTISDTGIGIPEKHQTALFEKFNKKNMSHDKFTRGAGLGLPISKLIIDKMKGKIWFESKTGIGSKFYIEIPTEIKKTNNEVNRII